MGKERVYRIRGVRDWDMAAAVERTATSFDEVSEAIVADTGREPRWEFLKLDVSGPWPEAKEMALAACLRDRCGVDMELPALADRFVEADEEPVPEPACECEREPQAQPGFSGRGRRQVSMSAAVSAVIVAVVLSVLLTYSLTALYGNRQPTIVQQPNTLGELSLIARLFESEFFYDVDGMEQVLLDEYMEDVKALDRYAKYYTAEEWQAEQDSWTGQMCGIGVIVQADTVTVADKSYPAIRVIHVMVDSSAEAAGLKKGDLIMAHGRDENAIFENFDFKTEENKLRGEAGSTAEFVVWRKAEDGEFQKICFAIERKTQTSQSVYWDVCETDGTVGVIHITEFNQVTAKQLDRAVTELQAENCTSFVLDLRGNGGGLLYSVEDALTYFLQKDDVMLYIRDRNSLDQGEKRAVTVQNGRVTCGSGTLTEDQVGKFADLSMVLLVDETTASAAELFTAAIRYHYESVRIVGQTTYGKGVMQHTFDLSNYGEYEGAVKMTTAMYDPPAGKDANYDGKGIAPDCEVVLDQSMVGKDTLWIPHKQDNQLQAAIQLLK